MAADGAWIGGLGSMMAVALAAVFAIAGGMKIHRSSAPDMRRLGLPLPRVLALVVPIIEVATARTLLIAPRWGATSALVLLMAFNAVLVHTIRSGRTVSCGCLGSLTDSPIGWTTVFRNGVLGLMALFAMQAGTLSAPSPVAFVVFIGFVLAAAVIGQLIASWQEIGRLWSVQLAGEARRSNGGGPS